MSECPPFVAEEDELAYTFSPRLLVHIDYIIIIIQSHWENEKAVALEELKSKVTSIVSCGRFMS